MISPDSHTLTGAYALDALDDLERRQFSAHLADCPDCATEVNELRATAAKLGVVLAVHPPESLHHSVMTQIATTRQHSPINRPTTNRPRPGARPRRAGWAPRITAAVAGLAAAVALVLGVLTVRTAGQRDAAQTRLAQLQDQYAVLTQLVSAKDTHRANAQATNGAIAFVLASHKLNQAVLVVSHLPKAPPGHIYQAWLISQSQPRSLGLLPGRSSTTRPVSMLMFAGLEQAAKVGVTIEPNGGSAQPTTTAVVLLDVPA